MAGAISLKAIVVAGKDQVACSLGEEAAILHMGSGVYYGLDPVGARIWNLVQQPRSVEELEQRRVPARRGVLRLAQLRRRLDEGGRRLRVDDAR